jgi:hypothetical protein
MWRAPRCVSIKQEIGPSHPLKNENGVDQEVAVGLEAAELSRDLSRDKSRDRCRDESRIKSSDESRCESRCEKRGESRG